MPHARTFFAASEPLDAFDALTSALEDPRPHPDQAALAQLGCALMTELLDLVLGGALEDHVGPIAESLLGGLHSGAQRLERQGDRARDQLARELRDFDGSEVADVDLQTLRGELDALAVAQRAVELVRDAAAETYTVATGEPWSPWRGSIRARGATAAQIDAQSALRAREDSRRAAHDPGEAVVAFRASPRADSPEDATRIFDALNWAKATWPQMGLAVTGAPGGERLARRWASQKGVPLVLARPDFNQHGRAAPFRANDLLMALQPVCVLTLSRSLGHGDLDPKPFGPVLNLIDQAQRAGVRCVRLRAKGTGAAPA